MSDTKPILVIALHDSLSIARGKVYEWHEYPPEDYERYGEKPPFIPVGTLRGVGGVQPTCVGWPKNLTEPIAPPQYLDWL